MGRDVSIKEKENLSNLRTIPSEGGSRAFQLSQSTDVKSGSFQNIHVYRLHGASEQGGTWIKSRLYFFRRK